MEENIIRTVMIADRAFLKIKDTVIPMEEILGIYLDVNASGDMTIKTVNDGDHTFGKEAANEMKAFLSASKTYEQWVGATYHADDDFDDEDGEDDDGDGPMPIVPVPYGGFSMN